MAARHLGVAERGLAAGEPEHRQRPVRVALERLLERPHGFARLARLEQHFAYNANATYIVITPNGKSESGFGTGWCAWHAGASVPVITQGLHGKTSTTYAPLAYAYVPYIPDAGKNCGMNFVNRKTGPLDQGYFDGFSIVSGHEYAEAITDSYPSSVLAWVDSQEEENADKCAWGQGPGPQSAAQNVSLSGGSFAVQSLWSNLANGDAGGCVILP